MSDIFISYNSNDRDRVERLVRCLEQEGFDVWWDQKISPGAKFVFEIEKQIKAAKCVVVVWSKTSLDRGWVLTEAEYANTQGILIPILFDQIEIPFAFRLVQTADMINWDPNQPHPGFSQLLNAISEATGRVQKTKVEEPDRKTSPRSSQPRMASHPIHHTQVKRTTPSRPPMPQPTQQSPIQAPNILNYTEKIKVHWKLSLPGEVQQPPILSSDGTVYIITRNGALVCADKTGKMQWSAILGGGRGIGGQGITLSPTGDVLAVTDSYVNCVSSSGTIRWRWTEKGGVTNAPAVGPDGTLYAMTNNSVLWAVSKKGESIWSRKLCAVYGGGSWPSPAYSKDGLVFAACKGRNVYGVNADDGDLVWEFAINDTVAASPVVGSDGTGYFASNSGWVFAIDPSGRQLWVASVSGGSGRIAMIDAPLAISTHDIILVAPRHGKVFAITSKGEIQWNTAVGGQGTGDRPVAVSTNGHVYAATTRKELIGILSNGKEFLRVSSGDWLSAPAVGLDDTLYIGIGAKLFALQVNLE